MSKFGDKTYFKKSSRNYLYYQRPADKEIFTLLEAFKIFFFQISEGVQGNN